MIPTEDVTLYVVESQWDVEDNYPEKLLETASLETAIDFAKKEQAKINWGSSGNKEYWTYITVDKYVNGKLIETVDFRNLNV